MSKVLLVIDYENEWVDKNSEYFVGDISEQIKATNKVIDFCRKKGIPIIFITHIEQESDKEFKGGTDSVKIMPQIHLKPDDLIIKKYKISPFYGTKLEKKLEELKAEKLITVGILTNLCVRSAVADAYDRDFEITIIKDGCAAMSEDIQKFTLLDLEETRPEIEIKTAEEFISENA